MPLSYFILFLLTPVLIITLLRVSGNSILKSNVVSPLILSYFIFSFIGFPLLFNNITRYNHLVGSFNHEILLRTFFYSIISIFILVISYILSKCTLSFYRKGKSETKEIKSVGNKFIVLIFLFIGIIFLLNYISKLSSLAIIQILLGADPGEISLARSEATNNLTKAWRFQFFPEFVIPFLSYYFYTEYKLTKKRSFNLAFIATASITIFYGIMNAQKSPVLFYIWSLIFLKHYIEKRKINLRTLTYFSIGSLTFLSLLLYFISGSNINSILTGIFNRITAASITSGYFYVKIFPMEHPFLTGLSSPNPRGIFPFESFELTKYVMLKMEGPDPNGAVGSAPGPFWSELYANFGFLGIVIGSSVIGALLAFVEKIFISKKLNSINAGLFTLMVFQFREISTSGPLTFLFPLQLVLVTLIAVIIQFSIKIKR